MVDTRNYTVDDRLMIKRMKDRGWIHTNYPELLQLIAEERQIVVTSKGTLIFYRDDSNV